MALRLVVVSDLHVHSWAAFSHLSDEGVNDRLEDTLRVLRIVREKAVEHRADAIIFAGDLFHVQKLDAEVLALTARELAAFDDLSIPVLAIEGNHDQAARSRQLTSVSGTRVSSNWKWLRNTSVTVKGYTIWGAPFGFNELPNVAADIAVLHRGVSGAVISDYFQSPFEDDLRPDEADDYASKLVICGHYHRPQVIREGKVPILIPGAPLQHTWGDAGQERGIWIVDLVPELKLTMEPLNDFPKFIKVNEETLEELEHADGNFVAIEFAQSPAKEDMDSILDGLEDRARGFSVQAGTPEVTRPAGVRMDVSTDLEKAVVEYAKRFGKDRADRLSVMGLEYLKRARKQA